MTTTKTQPTPTPAPDAQPVQAPYWRDGRVTDPEKYAAWIAKRADDARAALQMARGAK
jgi:hypothetical protein